MEMDYAEQRKQEMDVLEMFRLLSPENKELVMQKLHEEIDITWPREDVPLPDEETTDAE